MVGFVGKEYSCLSSSFLHFTSCECPGCPRETCPVTLPGHLPLSSPAVTFEAGDNFSQLWRSYKRRRAQGREGWWLVRGETLSSLGKRQPSVSQLRIHFRRGQRAGRRAGTQVVNHRIAHCCQLGTGRNWKCWPRRDGMRKCDWNSS